MRGRYFRPRIRKPLALTGLRANLRSIPTGNSYTGIIVKETRNMVWLRGADGSIKKFPKEVSEITIESERASYRLSALGRGLIGRPEDRMKKTRHIWIKQ